jgi:hypothetical protein
VKLILPHIHLLMRKLSRPRWLLGLAVPDLLERSAGTTRISKAVNHSPFLACKFVTTVKRFVRILSPRR